MNFGFPTTSDATTWVFADQLRDTNMALSYTLDKCHHSISGVSRPTFNVRSIPVHDTHYDMSSIRIRGTPHLSTAERQIVRYKPDAD